MSQLSMQFVQPTVAAEIVDAQIVDAQAAAPPASSDYAQVLILEEPCILDERLWPRRIWDGVRSAAEWLFGATALIF
jgi:hypothetical protein